MKVAWIVAGALVCALITLIWMLALSQRSPTPKELMWDKLELPQLRNA